MGLVTVLFFTLEINQHLFCLAHVHKEVISTRPLHKTPQQLPLLPLLAILNTPNPCSVIRGPLQGEGLTVMLLADADPLQLFGPGHLSISMGYNMDELVQSYFIRRKNRTNLEDLCKMKWLAVDRCKDTGGYTLV